MTKKIFLMQYSQHPELRDKPCNHTHMPYTGTIPCTGPRRCTMCGAYEDEIDEGGEVDNKTLIDETIQAAKLMAGASWPSADTTRWALEKLAESMDRELEIQKGISKIHERTYERCGVINRKLRDALKLSSKLFTQDGLENPDAEFLDEEKVKAIAKDALDLTPTKADKVVEAMVAFIDHATLCPDPKCMPCSECDKLLDAYGEAKKESKAP